MLNLISQYLLGIFLIFMLVPLSNAAPLEWSTIRTHTPLDSPGLQRRGIRYIYPIEGDDDDYYYRRTTTNTIITIIEITVAAISGGISPPQFIPAATPMSNINVVLLDNGMTVAQEMKDQLPTTYTPVATYSLDSIRIANGITGWYAIVEPTTTPVSSISMYPIRLANGITVRWDTEDQLPATPVSIIMNIPIANDVNEAWDTQDQTPITLTPSIIESIWIGNDMTVPWDTNIQPPITPVCNVDRVLITNDKTENLGMEKEPHTLPAPSIDSVSGVKDVTALWDTRNQPITTPVSNIGDVLVGNDVIVPWDTKDPPSTSTLVTRRSILYVIYIILALSVLYVIGHGLYTLFRRRSYWFRCWSRAKKEELPSVELEESAGVSWTDGSNISSPQAGIREPGEWPDGWAGMTAVDRLDNQEAAGAASTLPSPTGTIRRHRWERLGNIEEQVQ